MFGPPREHWKVEDCFKDNSMVFVFNHQKYKARIHSHDFYEINIINRGTGIHHMGKHTFEANVGDVYVIPPLVTHGYSGDEEMDIYHILIKKEFLARYEEELLPLPGYHTLFEIEPYLRQTTPSKYFLHLSPDDVDAIGKDIQKAHNACLCENYAYAGILALGMIASLCMHINSRTDQWDKHPKKEAYPLIKALEYIQNNLEKKLTIDELCSFTHMSAATLNRRFRQTLKTSPLQYITRCRINKALKLIAENELPKSEIALMCGFYDSSHMNKYIANSHTTQIK